MLQHTGQAGTPWGDVRDQLARQPHLTSNLTRRANELRRANVGGAPIHPSDCACRSCLQRDPRAFVRRRRQERAWAILFIGMAAALYGFALAELPQIAAAFGWHF